MGKPDFNIFEYFSDNEKLSSDFYSRSQALEKIKDIIKNDICSIEIFSDSQVIALKDGRKYNWKMNSINNYNFTVLTHQGYYEKEMQNIINKIVRPKDIIFDVGANKGWYSVYFGLLAHQGKVYSFEPVSTAMDELLKNIQINNLDNVFCIRGALYDYKGYGKVYTPYKHSPLSSLKRIYDIECDEEKCKLFTLDDFCKENNIDNIDIIKIDVEGAEVNALMGGIKMLSSSNAPILVVESYEKVLRGFEQNVKKLFHNIKSFGFEIYMPCKEGIRKVEKKDDISDTDLICVKKNNVYRLKDLLV